MDTITPVVDQASFRGRDDDVGLNTDTWNGGGGLNGNWTQDTDTNFRIRFEIEETAGGTTGNTQYAFEYNLEGAGWFTCTLAASSVVQIVTSAQYTDGDAATQLIGDAASYVNGDGVEDPSTTTGNINLTSEGSESECVFQIRSDLVSDGQTVQVRVAGLDGYTVTPTITINEPSAAARRVFVIS